MPYKRIKGSYYFIHSSGYVVSTYKKGNFKKLKPAKDRYGYLYVVLIINNKRVTKKVHRLVGEYFLVNKNNSPVVHHKDEVKTNNTSSNLEWTTVKNNSNFSNAKPIAQITKEGSIVRVWQSATEAKEKGGFCRENVSNCALQKPKHKTHKGFIWKFVI